MKPSLLIVDASRARQEKLIVAGGEEIILEVVPASLGKPEVVIVRDRLNESQLSDLVAWTEARALVPA